MLPEAVIFDVDGLLVDTETCDYEAWRELHEAHGLELSVADYCHNAGLYGTWERMYETISQISGHSPEALHARRDPRFRELVHACLRPAPELVSLLQALTVRGVKRGIASSSDSDWVAYLVDGLGLLQEFQAVVTGHDVARRKPAPDVYLLAAERLGVRPQRCVALEDSTHGIQAARAAGMRVITIPNPISVHQDLSLADRCVPHFGDVTLGLLETLM
jgi:HAD superfamily hydrolase (TIGR01509 family)